MKATEAKRTGEKRVSVSLTELLQLSQEAGHLSLSALRIKSVQTGSRLSRLLGRGMDFAEHRRYQAGDDMRTIDWRVTARSGKVHTKLFTEEKEKELLLCGDLRSPMFFATKGVFKSVQASLMLGHLAWNGVHAGYRIGGVVIDDENHFEIRPSRGKKGVLPYLQKIADSACYRPKGKNSTAVPTLDEAIKGIQRVASPGGWVIVISDFRHLTEDGRNRLLQISRHCDLSLCFVYDSFEAGLPKNGHYPVTDGRSELRLNTYDKSYLEAYHRQFIERKERAASLSKQGRVHFMECSTEEDCFEVLKSNFS